MICKLYFAIWISVYCQYVSVLLPRQISLHLLCMEIKFLLIPNLFSSSHPRFTSLLQLFLLHHAVSSQVWTKPRSCWNGVIHGTWVAVKTSSTMWSVRSACLRGECAHGATTTLTSRHATSAWPSAAWLCGTYKLTHSTASRFKRSMVFPTRAHIHLSSLQWTSPQIRLVSTAAASCLPVKDQYWTFRHCQLSNTGKKIQKNVRECVLCPRSRDQSFVCM